jgi:hypothetical protein
MHLPTRRAALVVGVLLTVAACGSSNTPPPPPPSASAITVPGSSGQASILPIPITSEFGVGDNRTVFTLTDQSGKQVAAPDRTLTIGYHGPKGETIPPEPQTFIWAIEGTSGVYAGHATFPSAGQWTADFTTAAPGSASVTTTFSLDVKQDVNVIAPGDQAPSVKTPTLSDVGGDVTKISSDPKPVAAFYQTSEDAALAAHKPFVLIFATPKFCQSSVCGPTLDKLKPVAAAHPEMTFINVEPYKLDDSSGSLQPVLDSNNQLIPVEATNAFKLSTEPYVFVVGADGKVSSSFELVFSPDEIESAIKTAEAAPAASPAASDSGSLSRG